MSTGPVWCVSVVVYAILTRLAVASTIPSTSSAEPPGHAWFIAEMPRQRAAVVHVPPRDSIGSDGKSIGAPDGSVRSMRMLDSEPIALAAMGDGVVMVFEDAPPGFPNLSRRVGKFRMVHSGIADLWAMVPPDRLESLPNLPGEGRLLSLSETSVGLAALFCNFEQDNSVRLTLKVLVDERWLDVMLPEAAQSHAAARLAVAESPSLPTTAFRIEHAGDGPRINAIGVSGDVRSWTLVSGLQPEETVNRTDMQRHAPPPKLKRRAGSRPGAIQQGERDIAGSELPEKSTDSKPLIPDWKEEHDRLPVADPVSAADINLFTIASHRIAVTRNGDGTVTMHAQRGGEWAELARVQGVAREFCVLPLCTSARVMLLWKPPSGTSGSAGGSMEVREISAHTGRVLYAGPSVSSSPITLSDYRLIVLTLFIATSLVLAFILRAEAREVVLHLPKGVSLAEPSRRAVAFAIDFVIWFSVAASFFGLGPFEAVSPEAILSGAGFWAFASGLALAATANTILECLVGRSIGKVVTGCRVLLVRSRGGLADDHHPTFPLALLRNLLKWMLPPLGALLLADPEWRHPADRISRTVVVVDTNNESNNDQ